ncbi:hypothetical protein ACHAWC_006280 [Mediolabrus comicus]
MKIRFSLLLLLCPEARTVLAFSSIHNKVSSSLRLWNNSNRICASVSFDYTNNNDQNNPLIHAFQGFATCRWTAISLSAAIMLLSFTCTSFVHPCYAEDAAVASDVPAFVTELGLKPPTDDKPQIRLSEGALNSAPAKSKARTPILQGLVYFPERVKDNKTTETGVASISTSTPSKSKEPLDYYSDILVLTAVSAKDPNGLILAGAKFPVSTVRFPFSFSMYEQNLLLKRDGVKETWEEVQNTSDVIIKAYICPGDAATFPCEDREVKKYSEGVAKLITNLPGLREGEVIRAPASLPL